MSAQHFQSFEEFWPFYVREHSQPATRTYHFIGTSLGLICLALMLITGKWGFILIGLVISYGFAWFSHFFIEKNRPATFSYPLYSFRGDFRMYLLMWRGQMSAEAARVGVSANY